MQAGRLQQVRAPDPESNLSPMVEETADAFALIAQQVSKVALRAFNDWPYRHGRLVCSGPEVLQRERGTGSGRPDATRTILDPRAQINFCILRRGPRDPGLFQPDSAAR